MMILVGLHIAEPKPAEGADVSNETVDPVAPALEAMPLLLAETKPLERETHGVKPAMAAKK